MIPREVVDGESTLGQGFSLYIEPKIYPLVRRLSLAAGLMAIPVTLALMCRSDGWMAAPELRTSGSRLPLVAWVDYDVDPARRVFDSFAEHFRKQRSGRADRVALEFVGGDVADPRHRASIVEELVRRHPAVIVATSVAVALAVQRFDDTVPVYFISQSDPVRDGLVTSLTSTGFMTGYTFFAPLDAKTIEIIKRIFPKCKRVGMISDEFWLEERGMGIDLFAQTRSMGVDIDLFQAESTDDIDHLLQDPRAGRIDVWFVPYSPLAFNHGSRIAEILGKTNLPIVYARSKFLDLGGALSVQTVDPDAMEIWARTIAHILDGVPIQSIPIMHPKEIEVAANPAAVARLDADTRRRIAREVTTFRTD